MATVKITRCVLECDGCKTVFGTPKGYLSAVEARAAAYAAGWRFPNQVGQTGKPLNKANDVCPECAPGWTPQPKPSLQRQATAVEMERWS